MERAIVARSAPGNRREELIRTSSNALNNAKMC